MEEKARAQILLSSPQASQVAANIQDENDLQVAPNHIRQHSRKHLLPKNPSTNKINVMSLKPPNSDPEPIRVNTLAPEEEMICVDRNLSTSTTLLHSSESQARPSRPITKRRLTEVEPSTQHDDHRRKSRRLI